MVEAAALRVQGVQVCLAHKKHPPRRTLQQDHAYGPIGVLGGWASYGRGTPVGFRVEEAAGGRSSRFERVLALMGRRLCSPLYWSWWLAGPAHTIARVRSCLARAYLATYLPMRLSPSLSPSLCTGSLEATPGPAIRNQCKLDGRVQSRGAKGPDLLA